MNGQVDIHSYPVEQTNGSRGLVRAQDPRKGVIPFEQSRGLQPNLRNPRRKQGNVLSSLTPGVMVRVATRCHAAAQRKADGAYGMDYHGD